MKPFTFYNLKEIKPILTGLAFLLTGCQPDVQYLDKKPAEMVISQYIESNPDFSEFNAILEASGLKSGLSIRGPYTLFLPDNEAMYVYYKLKNVNSSADFSDTLKDQIIRNHIIAFEIPTDEMGLGALSQKNALGDYLVSEFDGSDIIISKYSKIIKRNIHTANGFIHVVNRVLDPVTKDIFSVVASDPSYKIFTEGLELTGIKDTLQIISFPFGKTVARTRFTVLAVADTIYHRYGIFNVGDLIQWCGSQTDSLTCLNNPFYRYIEYHCLNGSYYLSDLNTGLYPVISVDNNIMFTIDTDYKINFDKKTKKYTGFNIQASNTPAKNGALHSVNDIMPVTEPEPVTVIFETTDFFDLKQGDYYGKYYWRFFDGENTFAKIHWEGDFLLYFYSELYPELKNLDCLKMGGWWTISVTFPKVIKGKYKISIFQPDWSVLTNSVVYIDGVLSPYVYVGFKGGYGFSGGLQKIGEVNFPTTAEHTITLRNIASGELFWDYVVFEPIK